MESQFIGGFLFWFLGLERRFDWWCLWDSWWVIFWPFSVIYYFEQGFPPAAFSWPLCRGHTSILEWFYLFLSYVSAVALSIPAVRRQYWMNPLFFEVSMLDYFFKFQLFPRPPMSHHGGGRDSHPRGAPSCTLSKNFLTRLCWSNKSFKDYKYQLPYIMIWISHHSYPSSKPKVLLLCLSRKIHP